MQQLTTQLRKELHQYPELSGKEFETAKRLQAFIACHHPTQIIDKLGGSGFAAIYEFPTTGPTIAIRCELDALPIEENNRFAYQSMHQGISHKCGHDGHMAIVAGLIFWIKKQTFPTGTIILLFQPAEETGKGAYQVLADPRFEERSIDYLFALHNIPEEPLHHIITMDSGFSAEVQSFAIDLQGKESHASEPENGINPANAIAELIAQFSTFNIPQAKNENFAILTPVHLTMGQKAYGVSPATGALHYTIRTWSPSKMRKLEEAIKTTTERICHAHQLTYQIRWFEHFPASENNSFCNEVIAKAAHLNNLTLQKRPYPFKFGEDFGWFSQQYKTGMFGLGAGIHTPALHNATYDFPDALLETGISMFAAIIDLILNE